VLVSTSRDQRKKREAWIMTLSEYLATPESVLPTELAFGQYRVADSPFAPHQRLVGDLYLALAPFARERRLGEVFLAPFDVILDKERALVVQPDLLFVSIARSHIVLDHIYGAPDLVIEILSPNPRVGRLQEKLEWYARYGVAECWLVHEREWTVEVLTLSAVRIEARRVFDARTPIVSPVLPGFARTLDEISSRH
jgi:Uma2 family endonuclease